MTRETKIGLLVGLGFIILIGILIADYSADAMKRPPAPEIRNVANTVLQGANNPGMRRPNGEARQGAKEPTRQMGETRRGGSEVAVMSPQGPAARGGGPAANQVAVQGNRGVRLDNGAGALVVPDNSRNVEAKPGTEAETKPATPGMIEVVAAEGDTVYGWARKHLGAGTPENQDAIFKANPKLKNNAKGIKVGEKYQIPVPSSAAAKGRNDRDSGQPTAQPLTPTQQREAAPSESPAKEAQPRETRPLKPESSMKVVMYKTKPGDYLYKIASDQCGDSRLVAKILELNKDVLKGDGREIKPNMMLKLPAKGT